MRARLYRPAESEADLEALAGRMRRGRAHARGVLVTWLLLAVGLGALNLLNPASPTDPPDSGVPWWSLVVICAVGVAVLPFTLHRLWLVPRTVAAQRELFEQRRAWSRIAPIRRAEQEISERLAALEPRRLELEGVLSAVRKAADRRVGALLGAGSGGRQTAGSDLARLDAYLALLRNFLIDDLRRPDLLSTPAAERGLERALALLGAPSPDSPSTVRAPTRPEGARHSIVVLPFVDLSPGGDPDYFGDGLAEELISALTPIPELRVIARGSAFAFRGRDPDLRQIARRLAVDTVIEGSVRRAGERIRVAVQMVRADDGLHLWSSRYDRRLDDLFAVQDEIAAAVVDRLREEVLAAGSAPRVSRRTEEIAAYPLYLKGRHLCAQRTPAELEACTGYFRRALELDPEYALAHAGLADAYDLLGYYGVVPPAEAFPAARQSALAALEIDPELAEAHAALAFARLLHDWEWEEAAESFARSLELNPGYATARHWYAESLAFQGRHDEALEQVRTALALDPLSLIINALLGWSLYYARRYREAVPALEETLRLGPDFAPAEFWLGLSYERLGEMRRAEETLRLAVERSGRNPIMVASLGRLHALEGREEEAREALDELTREAERRYVPAYWMAALHSGFGESEAVWEQLRRALERRESWMVFLGVDPIWDPIRERARFGELLRAVGLEGGTA